MGEPSGVDGEDAAVAGCEELTTVAPAHPALPVRALPREPGAPR
ncbi:MAG: hypothetical protein U0166_07995 [Acidobacteriota bacterium]